MTPTTEPTTIPTRLPTTFPTPVEINFGGIRVTMNKIEFGWNGTPFGAPNPPPGYQYILFDFSITNADFRDGPYGLAFDPKDVTLQDAHNYGYVHSNASYLIQGAFHATNIKLGETQRGILVFLAPASDSAKPYSLKVPWFGGIHGFS
jgi:hypothetical protein